MMAANSPLWKEQLQGQDELAILELTTEQLSKILEFVYKGKISVRSDERKAFLQNAKRFCIQGLPISDEDKPISGKEKPISGEDEPISGKEKSGKQKPNIKALESEPPKKKKKAESAGIENLPDEVLVKILCYLPTCDILQNVALVSKRFKALSEDCGAHIVVNLHNNIDVKSAVQFLERATLIEELHISCPTPNRIIRFKEKPESFVCCEIFLAIALHDYVRVINVANNSAFILSENLVRLSQTKLFRSSLLTKLILPIKHRSREPTLETQIRAAVLSLKNAKNLRHLDFGDPYLGNFAYFVFIRAELLEVALACPMIHTFKPTYGFDRSDFQTLIEARKETLTELKINHYQLPFNVLSECTKLQKLYCFPQFNSTKVLTSLKNLSELEMEIWSGPAFAPNSLPQIKSLSVTGMSNVPDRLISLANACPNLRKLEIFLNDDGVRSCLLALREFVVRCQQLEVIYYTANFYEEEFNLDQGFEEACNSRSNLKIVMYDPQCELSKTRIEKMMSLKQIIAIIHYHSLYVQGSTTAQEIGQVNEWLLPQTHNSQDLKEIRIC
jgi:hypothetical protein